jgi:iron complex outermembrane receptor protein
MRPHLTALLATLALAAQQSAAQVREGVLEEVIVTAQLRSESVISTPVSIFTLNTEQLENQRIDSISDLNGLVPNLAIDSFPSNNQTLRLFIRGVGLADTQITQDPAVGVYLNGAYIARSTGLTFDVADLERIEVLRGPQGTLYGRNTTGGAVKLITRAPDLENLSFDQTLGTGNQDLFRSKTSVNIPFAEKYAAKVAYFYEDVDGYTKNDGPGGGFGDRRSKGFRLDLRADLSADLTLNYGLDDSRIRYYNYTAQAVIPRAATPGDLQSIIAEIVEPYIDYSNDRFSSLATTVPLEPTDTHINGHTLNADWTINDRFTARSITAWRELHDKTYTDFASGSAEGFRIDFNSAVLAPDGGEARQDLPLTRPSLQQEQFSQEFQLLGSVGDSIEYLAGLYYFWEKADEDAEPLHHIFSVYPAGDNTLYRLSAERNKIENDTYAFFAQGTWTPDILEQRLHLTLGGRTSRDSREADRSVTDLTVADDGTSLTNLLPPATFSANPDRDFDDTSYTAIIQYDLGDNVNVYTKYAGAYKSGGFNIRDPQEEAFSNGFDEEKINAFEIGAKGEVLDHRLRFSAVAFYQKYKDYQYNFQIPGTIGNSRVFNLDTGEMSGVEIELTAMPVLGLVLTANYAYLDSKLDDVENPFYVPGNPLSDPTVAGGPFPYAPEHSYSLVANYTFGALSFGVLSANASYSYTGDRGEDSLTTYRDAYQLINARVSLSEIEALGGQWEIAAWGKNIADQDYEAFALDNLPQANRAVIWGDGRSYGVDVVYRFF